MEKYFTETHEWISVEDDIATVGITDYAQNELGDIVYIELNEVGVTLSAEEPFGVIESVKAASDIYVPVSGEIVETNQDVVDEPALINEDPQGKAWMIKVKISNRNELENLLSEKEYKNLIEV